jgi:hypothetical protein
MRRALTLALLSLAGCAHQPAPAADAAPAPAHSNAQKNPSTIRLERGSCYGRCPEYAVTVSTDGVVRFEGRRNTKKTGTDSARVSPKAAKALFQRFDKAGFAGFADRYTHGTPGCTRYIADLPTVTTTLTRNGVAKRVERDGGCRGAPSSLPSLEQAVDSVAQTTRWIGPR